MAIYTRPTFYYGHVVTEVNRYIDFDEGTGEVSAILRIGNYSFFDYTQEIARAMSEVGVQDYAVTANRTTRNITIQAPLTFSLTWATGSHTSASAKTLSGFISADLTGANSYTGTLASGKEYRPQFFLKDYTPKENFVKKVSVSKSESSSGVVEVLSFGSSQFTEFNLVLITNLPQPKDGIIENNASAVVNTIDFLTAITDQQTIEFMPDRDTPTSFSKAILESSESDGKGTGFKLKELINKNIPNYYETGKLTFRILE